MARSTLSRVPQGVIGVPQVAGDFNKFDKHATPKFNLGYKVEGADGKVYRYSHFGDDTNRGVLVGQDISENSVVDTDNSIIASASAVNTTDGLIGSYYIQLTLAGAIAGQYAGGVFVTTDDAGEGYSYDIIGNTATHDPATDTIRIQLAQPLQVAVTTATDFAIVGNLYNNLETATAAADCIVSGVSCSTMDVSEQAWGWIQTKGNVGVLQDAGTVAVGDVVVLSAITSGAIGAFGGTAGATAIDMASEEIVGTLIVLGDSSGHSVIKLDIGD